MRLLLVEDDVQMGPALQKGNHAEALGDIEPYDLIVLDLGLPKRSGMEVLQNWRSRNNHVPVVILTARGSWEEKVHGFKAGADDYVAKPFQTEELLARISAVLKRSSGTSGGPLQVAGLLLDEDAQSVTLSNGSLFTLTGTEFRLLRYFMLHPGQVISKSRLTEHVYEYDSDKDSNVIEVYVNRLRHKVGTDLIQTRRGQGYIFGSA